MQRMGWGIDDVESAAMLALCKSARLYDAEKGAFSSYYMKAFDTEMKMLYRKSIHAIELSAVRLDERISEDSDNTIAELIENSSASVEDDVICMDTLRRALDSRTDKQRRIILLYARGDTQAAIARKLGITQPYASRVVNDFIKIAV